MRGINHNQVWAQDKDKAIEDFRKAVEIAPNALWIELIADEYTWWGKLEYRKGNLEEALDYFSYAIQIDPQNSQAYFQRSLALYDSGDAEGAEEDLDEFIILSVDNWAYSQSANARVQWGDLEGALSDLTTAVSVDPENYNLYLERAKLFHDLGRLDEANDDLTKYIDLGQNDLHTYLNSGQNRMNWRDIDGAIADFTKAIESEPEYSETYFERANAWLEVTVQL